MREPESVRWTGAGFELEVSRHSAWSSVFGLVVAMVLGVLMAWAASWLVEVGGTVFVPVLAVVAIGGVAMLSQWAEQRMREVNRVQVDPVRVTVNEASVAHLEVTELRWVGTKLEVRSGPEQRLVVHAPRLKSAERQWLLVQLETIRRACREREGEMPADLWRLVRATEPA